MFWRRNKTQQAEDETMQHGIGAAAVERICKAHKYIKAEEEQKRREIQETKRACIKRIEQEREAKAAEIDEIFERKRKQNEQDLAELEKQIKAEMQ